MLIPLLFLPELMLIPCLNAFHAVLLAASIYPLSSLSSLSCLSICFVYFILSAQLPQTILSQCNCRCIALSLIAMSGYLLCHPTSDANTFFFGRLSSSAPFPQKKKITTKLLFFFLLLLTTVSLLPCTPEVPYSGGFCRSGVIIVSIV